MKMRKKSKVELFKNIFLVFLVLACVLTGVMLKKYIFSSGTPDISESPSRSASADGAENIQNAKELFTEYMRSNFIIVNNYGSRHLYPENSERYIALSDSLGKILTDVFTYENISPPASCGDEEWTAALSAGSVYINLPCVIGGNETSALFESFVNKRFAGAEFDELALMPNEEDGVILYLRLSASGKVQSYSSDINADELRTLLKEYAGADGASFAYGFEIIGSPERYNISDLAYNAVENADISAVVPLSEVSVPTVTLGTSSVFSISPADISASPEIGRLVDMFGFDPHTLKISCDRDDVKIFESPHALLRVFPNGKIEFSSEQGAPVDLFSSENDSFAGVAGMISKLCKVMDISLSGGGANLRISEFEQTDGEDSLTFDYHISGIPLFVSEGEHAAEAKVKNGKLTEFKIYLKNFSVSSAVPTESGLAAIERLAAETPDVKITDIDLQYKNVSDGSPCICSWTNRQSK